MIESIATLDRATLARFGDIIDVRSPGEFALDHVPGAINLPVLSDAERAEVGTIYVRQSRFLARRIGAAHVARNIAGHLERALADKPGSYTPLVYCWRGGQRSNAMATVLGQVGWRVSVLKGGYKTWRRSVTAALYDAQPDIRVILLDGDTGSGKTEILARLSLLGVQTLDLEGLAGHRGSLFGALRGTEQPSQKMFESRLMEALAGFDRAQPIVVEAESSKIGERMAPPMLWKAMLAAPCVELRAPREARARYLVSAYHDIVEDPAALEQTLLRLPGRHGGKRLAEWLDLAKSGQFEALAQALVQDHYDPAYQRSRREDHRPRLGVVEVADLEPASQNAAAASIAELILDDVLPSLPDKRASALVSTMTASKHTKSASYVVAKR
jgi:tRNA 2-selenouridine synthase